MIKRTQHIISAKVAAFTIVESVIATTIVSILIGLAAMTYGNLMAAEKPLAVYQAQAEINRLLHDVKKNKAFFNETYEYESCTTQQEVSFYRGNKELYLVAYTIRVGEKIWHTEKHLVRAE